MHLKISLYISGVKPGVHSLKNRTLKYLKCVKSIILKMSWQ